MSNTTKPGTTMNTCSEYAELPKVLAHHETLKGRAELHQHHDHYGCAGAYEAAHRRFVQDVEALRPELFKTFLAWSAPFFSTSDAGVEAATKAFASSEAGRTLATLGEEPSGSGYIAKIHVLNGKIRDLETLRATIARVTKAIAAL